MRTSRWIYVCAGLLLGSTGGCLVHESGDLERGVGAARVLRPTPAPRLANGSSLTVRLRQRLAVETLRVGDSWRGVLDRGIELESGEHVAAGSVVDGIVNGIHPAARGSAPSLDLRAITLTSSDRVVPVRALALRVGARPGVMPAASRAAGLARHDVLGDGTEIVFRVL